MDFALGILAAVGAAAALVAAWVWIHAKRSRRLPEASGMQSALHAATATLPHLRRGLEPRSAERAVPYIRALTPDDRMHIEPRLVSSDPTCPLRSAVLAPLVVQERRMGTLIAFYRNQGRPSQAEVRVVQEAASLVAAQVELSIVAEQERRLAQAELRALRAQISPHFIYNALAAVAGEIHSQPERARELLSDFAEFTRYLFRDGRSYVTLGEEIEHVERYVRLEQARFRHLQVTIDIPAEVRETIVPSMSIQPLVENAVRHGVEQRAGHGRVRIAARRLGEDVELRVCDDGPGIDPGRVPAVLAGAGGGIGVSNVDARLRATFGERYALRIDSTPGLGTTAIMTVPNLQGEPEPAALAQSGVR